MRSISTDNMKDRLRHMALFQQISQFFSDHHILVRMASWILRQSYVWVGANKAQNEGCGQNRAKSRQWVVAYIVVTGLYGKYSILHTTVKRLKKLKLVLLVRY